MKQHAHHKGIRIPTLILLAIAAFMVGALFLAVKAPAGEYRCRPQTFCRGGSEGDVFSVITGRTCVTRRICKYREDYYDRERYSERRTERYERRNYRAPAYRDLDPRPEDVADNRRCKHNVWIRETGGDKLNEADARVSAQDRWSAAVEVRHGSLFSDVENAKDMLTTCVKKVPTTATQNIGASLLGQRHFVCEVEATPCAPGRQDLEPAKRRIERVKERVEDRDLQERRNREERRP